MVQRTVQFSVDEKCQSSAGSFLVVFSAEVDVTDTSDTITVDVVSTRFDPWPQTVEAAATAIRDGLTRVLHPRGLGGAARVTDLLVNEVDFSPEKFADFTARELDRCLAT